jgi:hypothetical protein
MRQFIRRRPSAAGAVLLVVLAACSDSASISAPEDAGTTLGAASAAAPGDTALTTKPFVPATVIDLGVTVGSAVAGKDSTDFTPLPNAKVTVYDQKLVRESGADTLGVSETAVANATTDANGKVRFNGLPAAQYRVEAVREGVSGGTASVILAPPYAAEVAVLLIVR